MAIFRAFSNQGCKIKDAIALFIWAEKGVDCTLHFKLMKWVGIKEFQKSKHPSISARVFFRAVTWVYVNVNEYLSQVGTNI